MEGSCLRLGIKDKGSPGNLKHGAVMEVASAVGSHSGLCSPSALHLSPTPSPCPPAPNIGAIHGASHQLPSPSHFNQLPAWKEPKRRTQLQLQMWKERSGGAAGRLGRKGSLTPSLLHHPQMMKPCQRFWKGYGLGAEDASLLPSPFLSLPHPTHR